MASEEKTFKEVNTLFHSVKRMDTLKSIIKNGFYPSYAEEFFAGRKQLILMVSFSNIPLIESRSQLDYGGYAIGTEREWGIRNGLHPVIYTYDGSEFGRSISITEAGSAIGQALDIFVGRGEKIQLKSDEPILKSYLELVDKNFTKHHAEKLREISEEIFKTTLYIRYRAKNYVVERNGEKKIAFNDREWRYIPKEGLEGDPVMMLDSGDRYEYWKKKDKPHGIKIPLTIKLEEIKYLVSPQKVHFAFT